MDEIQKLDRLTNTINLLTALVPELDELIADMEKSGGWFPIDNLDFPPVIKNLKLEDWAEFYLDEKTIRALPVLFLLDESELNDAIKNPERAREELKIASAVLLEDDLFEVADDLDADFSLLSEEDQQQQLKQASILILTMILGVFNALSGMIHGESLCKLVTKAKNGDDQAFCKAIQIDRTILFLPFAKERLIKAQLSNDGQFLEKLALKLKSPILGKKIKYRTLWLTFALLDDEGFLTLPHEDLLDICQQIGVYGKEFGIEDVGHMRKRLADYKRKNWN
jgi:hypothetical protein